MALFPVLKQWYEEMKRDSQRGSYVSDDSGIDWTQPDHGGDMDGGGDCDGDGGDGGDGGDY